jgi:hypothetical protein
MTFAPHWITLRELTDDTLTRNDYTFKITGHKTYGLDCFAMTSRTKRGECFPLHPFAVYAPKEELDPSMKRLELGDFDMSIELLARLQKISNAQGNRVKLHWPK